MTTKWYGLGVKGQFSATAADRVDWVTDTMKAALTTSTYVPNQDTNNYFSDVTNEITGTGYTAGGLTITTKTLTYDTATNETRLDGDDAIWSAATFTARIMPIYKATGVSTTSKLMGYVDFGGDQTVSTGTFTVQFDATGILKVTAA